MKKLFLALLVLTLAGCAPSPAPIPTAIPTAAPTVAPTPAPTPVPTATSAPKEPFRVIAYLTPAMVPEVIPYGQLTHINYAFLVPNADGTFVPFLNGWKLDNLVNLAHQAGVKVVISVGGWGYEKQFAATAADPALRAAFVKNLSDFVAQHDLDGADLDWEFPTTGQQSRDFLALVTELRKALASKLLTAAVPAYGANAEGIAAETFPLFDYLNVMTYDGPDHGTMKQFEDGLAYWKGRGAPAEKLVMGVPFYARPSETPYRKIVETDPSAAQKDIVTQAGMEMRYNGIPTIEEKTRRAMQNAGGIMFWTLDADASGDLSLLKAIDRAVHAPTQ